jgi:hypothetical protein
MLILHFASNIWYDFITYHVGIWLQSIQVKLGQAYFVVYVYPIRFHDIKPFCVQTMKQLRYLDRDICSFPISWHNNNVYLPQSCLRSYIIAHVRVTMYTHMCRPTNITQRIIPNKSGNEQFWKASLILACFPNVSLCDLPFCRSVCFPYSC